MTPAEFTRERKNLVKAILAQVQQYFWTSGYVSRPATDQRKNVKLWAPRNAKGELTMKSYSLKGGMVVGTFEGFTEEGVITGGYGHYLETTYWAGIPIEDLYRLNQWMQRMMPKLTAYDQQKKAQEKAASRRQRPTASAGAAAA